MKSKSLSSLLKADAEEIIEAMGDENEQKGISYTQKFMSEFDNAEAQKNQFEQDTLEKKTRWTKRDYAYCFAKMLEEQARDLDLEPGYRVHVEFKDELHGDPGVIIVLTDKTGKKWKRGIKPCGTPKIDHYCLNVLLIQVQNTMDKIDAVDYKLRKMLEENGIKRTESGIIIGN